MAKRKYEYYTVATDMDECYVRDYREALSALDDIKAKQRYME